MESLKDFKSKDYSYVSRYANFKYAYNVNDDKYIYELTSQLNDTTPHIIHKIQPEDTLDSLSAKYYGRPDLFWIIADFNRIQDPFIKLSDHFKELKVPSFTSISYKEK